jgi:hypothetical protein
MKVLDAGHRYELTSLDGEWPQTLQFVKRCEPAEKYPGNTDAYPGTTVQEVCRALIDRLKYVQEQSSKTDDFASWREDAQCIDALRSVIERLERRAARKHGRPMMFFGVVDGVEQEPTCATCGHIGCGAHR